MPSPTETGPAKSLSTPELPPSSLRERMGARFDLLGAPFQIYLHVQLAGRIDRPALATALEGLLRDVPRLRLRLTAQRFGYGRRFVEAAPALVRELIHLSQTEEEFHRRLALPLAIADSGPLRLELCEREEGTRLVLVMHHAVADGQGTLAAYERLAARYAEALGGPAAAPPPLSTDGRLRTLLGRMPRAEKLAALRSALAPLAEMVGRRSPVKPALFLDEPKAGFSELRTMHVAVPLSQAARLTRWAAKHRGSLTDLLVTAATRAGLRVWPQEPGRTTVVNLPVSLHEQQGEIADRTFAHLVRVPAAPAVPLEELFASVREQAAVARARTKVLVQGFALTLPSLLPPTMFRNAVGGFLRENPNGGDAFCVSNLGLFETRVGDFGPLPLEDAFFYALAPGLRLTSMPSRKSFNIVLSYMAPALTDASIAKFREEFEGELAALAAA